MAHPQPKRDRNDDDNDDDVAYVDLNKLARYSSLSVSTLRRALKHPTHPLPHRRWPPESGRVLVSKRAFDAWFEGSDTRPARDRGPKDPSDPSYLLRAFRK